MTAKLRSPGHIYLVVGPSGVGKDSLLTGAQDHFSNDPDVIFPVRTITRPADAGGEDHHAVDVQTFQDMKQAGAFALWWDAHGLNYGVPKSIDDDLSKGRTVVVNVSRGILDHARSQYASLTVVSITTSPEVLAGRLRARGREDEADISLRLARAQTMQPRGSDVVEVENSGQLEAGIACFVNVLSGRA